MLLLLLTCFVSIIIIVVVYCLFMALYYNNNNNVSLFSDRIFKNIIMCYILSITRSLSETPIR